MHPDLQKWPARNILTRNVLDDLDFSRETIASILSNAASLEDIRCIFSDLDKLDTSMLVDIMKQVMGILLPKIETHPDLCAFFWFKNSPLNLAWEDTSLYSYLQLKGLVEMALEEIFPLVCMHLNSWYNSKKLKSLVYMAMRHGSKNTISSMFYDNPSMMTSKDWEYMYNTLLKNMSVWKKKRLDITKVWKESGDYADQTTCPFLYNEKRDNFIDMIWGLFENEVIPILREKFKNSTNVDGRFLSGNL